MNSLSRFSLFISMAALVGCEGVKHSFSLASEEQSFQQNSQEVVQRKVDILWVIDNSGSMAAFQQNLTDNFQDFIQDFIQKDYDFHLAVTTTDAYLAGPEFYNNPVYSTFKNGNSTVTTGFPIIDPSTPDIMATFTANALQGVMGGGDERAFSSMRAALVNPMNAGFLRPGSFLAVIILSDEDDFSNPRRPERNPNNASTNLDQDYSAEGLEPVETYIDFLDQLTNSKGATERNFNVSVVGAIDDDCVNQHKGQSAGTIKGRRMMELAEKSGGVLGSICSDNYSDVLKKIQKRIIELSTEFQLNRRPQVGSIRVSINGSLLLEDPENGWTYNSASNSIVFHGTGIPPKGAALTILYDPAEALKPTEISMEHGSGGGSHRHMQN